MNGPGEGELLKTSTSHKPWEMMLSKRRRRKVALIKSNYYVVPKLTGVACSPRVKALI